MKKILSFGALALAGAMVFTGCGKDSVEGTYKFDSIEITTGEETTKITCTTDELGEHPELTSVCAGVSKQSIELKDNGKMVADMDSTNDASVKDTMESFYQIKDGKIEAREEETDEWEEAAAIEDGKIVMEGPGMVPGTTMKIIFKK